MKAVNDNFRSSSTQDVMVGLRAKGIDVVYEATVKAAEFGGDPVVADLKEFAAESDLILANRITKELEPFQSQIYSRDLLWKN